MVVEVKVNKSGETARVELQGQVDERGAEMIKEKTGELDLTVLKEVVFDFKDVDRIGSAGIGQLLLLYKNLAVNGGRMRVENVSNALYELFRGLKLDTLFTISKK